MKYKTKKGKKMNNNEDRSDLEYRWDNGENAPVEGDYHVKHCIHCERNIDFNAEFCPFCSYRQPNPVLAIQEEGIQPIQHETHQKQANQVDAPIQGKPYKPIHKIHWAKWIFIGIIAIGFILLFLKLNQIHQQLTTMNNAQQAQENTKKVLVTTRLLPADAKTSYNPATKQLNYGIDKTESQTLTDSLNNAITRKITFLVAQEVAQIVAQENPNYQGFTVTSPDGTNLLNTAPQGNKMVVTSPIN